MIANLSLNELFKGYQETPQLWKNIDVKDIKQLPIGISTNKHLILDKDIKQLRLGKWVEKFVTFQLINCENVEVLGESIQVKEEKTTIGELDYIFTFKTNPIHLEVVYKFYLYDPSIDTKDALRKWIGPNRNDSLIYKLHKLKTKQFPLLYHSKTKPILDKFGINPKHIKQYVHFKAKLFTPLGANIDTALNSDCIVGHYININMLSDFKDSLFFIPKKIQWLLIPNDNVQWISYNHAKTQLREETKRNRSPLVWVKSNNYSIKLIFVTWWG